MEQASEDSRVGIEDVRRRPPSHPAMPAGTDALVSSGATATVYEVMDSLELPFAVQALVSNASVDVVVAIGFLVKDAHWCSKEVRQSPPPVSALEKA